MTAGELDASCLALGHRGPDGSDISASADWSLAHLHFWTTPEEVGERQPLTGADGRVSLALDGRIDNRDELIRHLAASEANVSDAALVLRAYERWGEGCFARLLGPFAVCVVDRRAGRSLLARDPLGDRTLYYHLSDRLLVAASEEAGVLAHPGVPRRLDVSTLARLYAVEAPAAGATLFADVRELPPGHLLAVGAGHSELRAYWTAPDGPVLRLRSDHEYADAFRERLRDAVVCRMRARSPIGVLMSGGLDSTPVACLAARELTRRGDPSPLRVFSWVVDELPCDERRWIDTVVERYGLEAHRTIGDRLWPLSDLSRWPHDAGRPDLGIYRLLHESVWRAARDLGTTVLLTGGFGDHLYSGAERWLLDLLAERRVGAAAAGLLAALARRGPGGLRRDPGLRRAASLVLRPVRGRRLPASPQDRMPWLTPAALGVVSRAEAGESDAVGEVGRRFRRIATPLAAASAPLGTAQPNRFGVEVRSPYRDRRLVEFMASVPGHQVYRGGLYKHILREAMKGILPDRVRLRRTPTSYLPLYNRGFFEREHESVRSVLSDPDAWWPRFVRRDWLEAALARPLTPAGDGAAAVVPWMCVALELWRRTASPAEQDYLTLP